MTSTTETAGHPDVAEISDLTEGVLSPSRAAEVREHLDGCALCAEVRDSLEEIRDLLGTLPAPTRMPDDVAARIDAALAAEALSAGTAPRHAPRADEPGHDVSRETSVTDAPETPVTGVSDPRSTPASPSSVSRPSGHSHAATGPGRSHRGRPSRRRVALLGTAVTAAALGLGAIFFQTMGDDSAGGSHQTAQQQGPKDTYSEGTLQTRVTDLLAKTQKKNGGERSGGSNHPWGVESNGADNESAGVDTLITPAVKIPECVQQGTGSTGAVLAAEKGTYKGTSVYLVVLPDTSDSARVTAYLVDATCEKSGGTAPGKLLLTHSYARS
ncbi:zf-HC2 domain-containing protein [Streptomyces sp. NPDC096934]|uniref:anti-sigma factor family protein n=1 Tax=Streptomyces sp. NPDC096934 TaxID=3155551 RepID=UPI003330484E